MSIREHIETIREEPDHTRGDLRPTNELVMRVVRKIRLVESLQVAKRVDACRANVGGIAGAVLIYQGLGGVDVNHMAYRCKAITHQVLDEIGSISHLKNLTLDVLELAYFQVIDSGTWMVNWSGSWSEDVANLLREVKGCHPGWWRRVGDSSCSGHRVWVETHAGGSTRGG